MEFRFSLISDSSCRTSFHRPPTKARSSSWCSCDPKSCSPTRQRLALTTCLCTLTAVSHFQQTKPNPQKIVKVQFQVKLRLDSIYWIQLVCMIRLLMYYFAPRQGKSETATGKLFSQRNRSKMLHKFSNGKTFLCTSGKSVATTEKKGEEKLTAVVSWRKV